MTQSIFTILTILIPVSGVIAPKLSAILLPLLTISLFFYKKNKLTFYPPLVFVFLFLFACWGGITLFWSLNLAYSLKTFLHFLLFLIIAFLFIQNINALTLSQKELIINRCMIASLLFAGLFMIVVLFQNETFSLITHFGFSSKTFLVLKGRILKPSGTIISLFIFPLIGFLLCRKNYFYIFYTIILSIIFCYLSNSFSARVALLTGILTFMMSYLFPLVMTRFFLVSAYTYIILTPSLLPMCVKTLFHVVNSPSLLARFSIWIFSYTEWLDKPLLGWGIASSRYLPMGEIDYAWQLPRMKLHPHNNFLQIFLELGIIGGILSGLTILSLFYMILPYTKDRIFTASANATLISAIVVCSASYSVWHIWWLSWMVLAGSLVIMLKDYKTNSPL